MVDKQIRKGFKHIRATINQQEKEILKADIKADKERDRLKKKTKEVLISAYFGFLTFIFIEGISVLFTNGESVFDIVPNIPYISYPSSAIFFSIFGFILYKKWKFNTPLVWLGAYSFWESIQAITSLYINGEKFPWRINIIWISIMILALLVVKPAINFNNWSIILLLYFYANDTFPSIYHDLLIESLSQIILAIFIWKSFSPKSKAPWQVIYLH